MRMLARFGLSVVMAASLLLSGCIYVGDWGETNAYREDFHSTHPLNAGGTVSVEGFNGAIEITGWEQNSVEVNGTKYSSTKGGLDAIKVDVSATPGSVRIRCSKASDLTWHNMGVRISLRVPHKVLLDPVSTSNGKIQVEDVEGTARLHTSNGAIRLGRIKGDIEARTSNGTIEAMDMDGDVRFHTSNGSIRAEATHGPMEATTSNGGINVRMRDSAGTRPMRLESSNGHIEATIEGGAVPEVRATTSNSSILLRLPASANAQVRASTSHSSITTDFDELSVDRRKRHSEVEGTLGRGGPMLDLRSSNGAIKILKL